MANTVIKKDGTKVPFDAEKIRIAVSSASSQAGTEQDRSNELAEEILDLVTKFFAEKEEVTSDEIKEKIFSELEMRAPAVLEAWKKYEETKAN